MLKISSRYNMYNWNKKTNMWFLVILIVIIIYSSLLVNQPMISFLKNQNLQAIIFLLGMLIVGLTIALYGYLKQNYKKTISLKIGFFSIILMLFLRLGLPERSHLIEYSILALFVNVAIKKSLPPNKKHYIVLAVSFLLTFLISLIDEFLQKYIAWRVFDLNDIVFNTLVISVALSFAYIMEFIRNTR